MRWSHLGPNVGRVAFVTPAGSLISPVSVPATGTSLVLDTSPGSSLSQMAEMRREVTLEVDDTLAISDHAWNALMHRPVVTLDRQSRQRHEAMSPQVEPQPGKPCSQALAFMRSSTGSLAQHPRPAAVGSPADSASDSSSGPS